MSHQTIAATISPNLLLSPNVFTQANTCPESTGVATEHSLSPEVPVLSRNQLQATLLTLIKVDQHIWKQCAVRISLQTHFNRRVCVFQSDSLFLDTIYEAYISRFANSTSKYWFPIARTSYIPAGGPHLIFLALTYSLLQLTTCISILTLYH